MNVELRKYLDELFMEAPKTRAAYELKEELLANSSERYFDLVESGMPEKEAFDIVVNSIGDIDQLFETVEPVKQNQLDDATIKKIALFKAVAIGMYILGFALMFTVSEVFNFEELGFIMMLVMAALATSILVYVGAAFPKYKKSEETVVEEFKEWNHNNKKSKAIRGSVSSIVWMLVVVLYFLISFGTGAWHITWIIFLVGGCAQAIVNLLFQLNDKQ